MSQPTLLPDVPEFPAVAVPATVSGVRTQTPPPPRSRRRFWLLLALTLAASVVLYAPLWQELLRMALTHEAERRDGRLTIGRIEGGPFDAFQLYDVRLQGPGSVAGNHGTDLRVVRVDLVPAWPTFRRDGSRRSWLRSVALEGLSGRYDLSALSGSGAADVPSGNSRSWLSRNASRFVPDAFLVRSGDVAIRRGRYQFCCQNLRLDASRNGPGLLLVKEIEISGPGFQNTFLNRHAQTTWEQDRLTITGLEFAPGVRLTSGMIDGTHLGRRHLDWEGSLVIHGGEVRAQGGINLSRTHVSLELAGTMRQLPVQPLARLLGVTGSAGGLVQQGSFSFRGDPADPAAAQMWLAGQATDFRWGHRRWQSLELQTVVLHRRVQVNRLELRQSRNQLSLHGEFPLPVAADASKSAPAKPWWQAGFSCQVDARLDDLHALSMLVGPRFPALEGRMSVNGALEALPGRPGIDGYLNVEGSQLTVRGAPLDFVRSTLIFQGDEMQVADLQTTHGSDYLTGKWTTRLTGASQYQGELRVAVKDRAEYASALTGVIDLDQLGLASDDPHAPVQLDGTFRGPGPNGGLVFQDFGLKVKPVNFPVPAVGDWWRDD